MPRVNIRIPTRSPHGPGTMKLNLILYALLPSALAANSFAGANNYYIYALPQADRITILDGMQAAGMKVLRTWVTGHTENQKASNSVAVEDLEANGLGKYNDTVLTLIDQLMVDAHARGIKLLIGLHSQNALQNGDIYASSLWCQLILHELESVRSSVAILRIAHILNGHKNALLGDRPWSELGGYIFGWEPQNEPMIKDQSFYLTHLSWICNAAQQNQLIFTGGGSAGSSVQPIFFGSACTAIDLVAIHDYTDKAAGKKLVVEEWGSLVGTGRTANLNSNVQKINNYKLPWLYWELINNVDPHQDDNEDYEARVVPGLSFMPRKLIGIQIQVNGADWSTISSASKSTAALTGAPFDFSGPLTL
ncbi:glycoside hydrolase [Mycena leptocephala]|nr:glycoside hydrolase [Mycena leptocephala]